MDNSQEMTFRMNLDGQERTCTVLFTFYSDQTQANYMLYTPDDPEQTDDIHLIAGRFDPNNLSAIYPLQDDTDRALVQQFLDYVTNCPEEEIEEDDGIHTVEDL